VSGLEERRNKIRENITIRAAESRRTGTTTEEEEGEQEKKRGRRSRIRGRRRRRGGSSYPSIFQGVFHNLKFSNEHTKV
jgi:hypothetical protein